MLLLGCWRSFCRWQIVQRCCWVSFHRAGLR